MALLMRMFTPVRGPLLLLAAWLALAAVQLALRDWADAIIFVWLPSAVAVTALHLAPYRKWPALLASLFAAQFLSAAYLGMPWITCAGFGLANMAEAGICSLIRRHVLRAGRPPSSQAEYVGLFGAAIAGAVASAIVAFPFLPVPGAHQMIWWFFATVLGILTGTPLLLYLRRSLRVRRLGARLDLARGRHSPLLVAIGLFAISLAVLQIGAVPLLWVVVMAMVFAVFRNGQIAAALGVLAFSAAATLVSMGGHSPAAFLTFDPAMSRLVLQAMMLAIFAMSLPIASALKIRNLLRAKLESQNASLFESVTMLNLVKSLVGAGRWQIDLRSGVQTWSDRMLSINGLASASNDDHGDIRELLPEAGAALFDALERHAGDREPYSFHYTTRPPSGTERVVRVFMTNRWQGAQRVAALAAVMDVSKQFQREEELERERLRAMTLARTAQRLANTDELTGLPNRRRTLARLETLSGLAQRDCSGLAVVMFDIDHFKRINDYHGHKVGDDVLVNVAEIARRQVRESDLVGRIGGEEFIWLLPGAEDAQVTPLAERLRIAIEAAGGQKGLPHVTISMGIALYRSGESAAELLARADRALYRAKDGGRNRVRRAA